MKTNIHFRSYLAQFLYELETFRQNLWRKKNILCSIIFSENRDIYEKMRKNNVQSDRPQTTQYGAYALHAG